jgi:hypothetical protein
VSRHSVELCENRREPMHRASLLQRCGVLHRRTSSLRSGLRTQPSLPLVQPKLRLSCLPLQMVATHHLALHHVQRLPLRRLPPGHRLVPPMQSLH